MIKSQTLMSYSRKDLRIASTINSVFVRNEVFPASNNSTILSVKTFGIEIESYSFVIIIEYKLHLLRIMVIGCGIPTDQFRYRNDRSQKRRKDLNMNVIFCMLWMRYIYHTITIIKIKK